MTPSVRPRRSMLFMPGSNARAVEKARTLDCDGVILDLEDSVSPEAKETARAQVAAALRAGGFGHRERVVRINPLEGPWGEDDIGAMAGTGVDAILLPKVEEPATVRAAAAAMEATGMDRTVRLWAMIETPRGVLAAQEIARGEKRLEVFVVGLNDLAKGMRAPLVPGRTPFLAALSLCVLAARAEGLGLLDSVFGDLEDTAGFEKECRQGAQMGFDGKTIIHPRQIAAANRAFRPDADAVARARAVIEAWSAAESGGRGVAVHEGRMIERLHAIEAERILALDAAIAARQ